MPCPTWLFRIPAAALLALAAASAWPQGTALGDGLLGNLQDRYMQAVKPGEPARLHRDLLATLLYRVQRSHATEVDFPSLASAALAVLTPLPDGQGDPAEVFRTTLNAALRSFDPYARYVDDRAYRRDQSAPGGSFVGVGIEVESSDAGVLITAPMPGGPAARAGLRAGDLIVQVDDQPLRGVALSDAIARMRGDVGTQVSLVVRREGSDDFTLALRRDIIRRPLLRWHMEDDTLVLRLSSFSGPVSAALVRAAQEATRAHLPRAVVLDMRGNPGGLVREAVDVADVFLSHGTIASMRGRSIGNQQTWQADSTEWLAGLPMVVLMDKESASAAELVAAALQDHGRAVVMGQRSFGKGSVQSTYALGEHRGAVKITSALYYGPGGQTVNHKGVMPDVLLAEPVESTGPVGIEEDTRPLDNDVQRPGLRMTLSRCAVAPASGDATLSCALTYLRTGGRDGFSAALADVSR